MVQRFVPAAYVPGEHLALAWLAGVWGQLRPQGRMISQVVHVGEMPWIAC
jgi:hypothetical protein